VASASDARKRALAGECISRAAVEAARGATLGDIDAALAACDHERAATLAFACARDGRPVGSDVIARILPGVELPAITCSLIAIAPSRASLLEVVETRRLPQTRDGAELEAIVLYAAWKAGADKTRVVPPLRRLAARQLSAESYALLATIAAALDDANVTAACKPIAAFAKEYAKHVAADDKAMHATLDAVLAELPAEVDASAAVAITVRSDKQVGRNDPCPCGSGNKYKKCCADKPVAAGSRVRGPALDATAAGHGGTAGHVGLIALRDVVRIDPAGLSDTARPQVLRRLAVAHEWDRAERVAGDAHRADLARYLFDARQFDRARALVARLPDEAQREFRLDIAMLDEPSTRYAPLVEAVRDAITGTDELASVEIAYTLLRSEPVLGILAARACIGALHVDDPDLLLESVEEVRDELNLPPTDPAWDVLDALRAKAKKKPDVKPDKESAVLQAKVDELERKLAATRAELDAARTRPAAELVRTQAIETGLEAKVRELEGTIREGNAERRELRRQLEALQAAVAREKPADAPRADETDEGFDDTELGTRETMLPRFERRFADAIAGVPANVAAETMRTVGSLAAGDGFAWKSVKQAKDMARQVLMARVGIHHRLIMRVEEGQLAVLDLITREQLDTTLRRLRMR